MKRKLLALLMSCVLAATAFSGCTQNTQNQSNSDTPIETETTTSEESKSNESSAAFVENLYDPNFSIELLEDGIKKVIDGEGRELILVPKEMEEVPAEYTDSIVIRTPVENAVFLSSTQVCTFRAVDDSAIIEAIAGVSGGVDEWAGIPAIKEGLENGSIVDIGGASMGEPDYELIQSLNPDIVFLYTGSNPQTNQIAKFEELGINYAVDNEYMESNYLARMEWMRFILTFFNADEQVNEVMNNAQKVVDEVKSKIEGLEKPKVAVFSVYDGAVYGTSDNSWVGTMLSDMGGINAFSGMPEGTLTMEAAFECIQDADVIIYTSTPAYCNGMEGVMEAFPQLSECKAYENDRVYQYGESFWIGIDQSEIMAADLAAAIYPDTFADRTLTYYVKLEK
ncbi:ABC transporter substrate-binding protein [Negativibacillus massiliensis]|uniref:ABC transporter substrate-binding protein n=1 Tax=Negativibacillus massiliensis TaxID=1871035 RepID=UPI00033EB058|nr:ABC transporter substrate-binding protein [Negativibacillus massiliensis]MDY4048723.1 ABC transporter substrate-binding protein [Negativibacillus massiliensis]CDA76399.1 aBC-type transport system iron-family extracellular solute-binding protein [Clostridium sp. CAG:242]